jgi:hypothetical protein
MLVLIKNWILLGFIIFILWSMIISGNLNNNQKIIITIILGIFALPISLFIIMNKIIRYIS